MIKRVKAALLANDRRGLALRGTAWTTIGFVSSYAIRLLSTLILTRLLAPDVFGLMSLAGVFVTGVSMLSDVGTVPSIIRSKRGDDPSFLRTAWTIQLVRGGLMCLGLMAAAWPLSRLYDEPMLFPLLLALAFNPLIQGGVSIAVASCRRHTDLKWITVQDTLVQIATTVINVLAAWWLGSVWALVIGSLMGTLFRLWLSYAYLPQRVKVGWEWEREALDEIVRFGRWILLGTLFTYLSGQGGVAIMGVMVSVETLGLFSLATIYSSALNGLLQKIIDQVAFPQMSRMHQENPEGLARAVGTLKRMIFFYILPCYLALSLGARTLIELLYDPRYAEAGVFLSFTALNMSMGNLSMPYQNAMLTTGDSRSHALVMGLRVVLRTISMVVGYALYGMYGLLTGFAITSLIAYGVTVWLAQRSGRAHFRYDVLSLALIFAAYVLNWSLIVHG